MMMLAGLPLVVGLRKVDSIIVIHVRTSVTRLCHMTVREIGDLSRAESGAVQTRDAWWLGPSDSDTEAVAIRLI